jgi:phosphatidylglycerol:prolipoprotein diacylglycerol transferase
MHPILIQLGPLPIRTYGFCIGLGFLASNSVIKSLTGRTSFKVQTILDLVFTSVLVGFVGARLLYVLTQWDVYFAHPMDIVKVWEGGLVFFGGPLAVIPFLIWYTLSRRMPLWTILDLLTPGLVIAHAFGRIGCLMAGCCYGKPTGSSFGIRLDSSLVEPALRGIPLHPTQLYEAFGLGLLFLGLFFKSRKKSFEGQIAASYLLIYPFFRIFIEFFRGDTIRGFIVGSLSTSQFLSIFIVLAGVVTWILAQRYPDLGKL